MKTALTLLATSSVFAAVLLACGDDNEKSPSEPAPDAAPADAATTAEDASTPVAEDASDDGAPDAGHDARPPFDPTPLAVTCAVTPCITKIVGRADNYCATASDGVVRCWGNPTPLGGFVDKAATNAGATPVVLSDLGDIVDVGITTNRICAVSADGKIYCFGSTSQTPAEVPDVDSAQTVTVASRACAVLASGAVWCWGDNNFNGKGAGPLELGGSKAIATSIGDVAPGFALGENGTLYSWGPSSDALGRPSAVTPDLTPGPVVGLPPILQMASSNYHACALAEDGRLFCWGRSDNGALGLGYFRNESLPVEVLFGGAEWPTQIAAAQSHSCARMSDGAITCWSKRNTNGELGLPQTYGVFVPTNVQGLEKKAVSVAVGENSTCALLEDGSVQCWGANDMGQLAQGARDSSRHPTPATVVFP